VNKYETVELAPLARGKKELLKYLSGKRLTRGEALLANCYECMGYYIDGKADCKIYDCPLYQYMPYRKEPPMFGPAGRLGMVSSQKTKSGEIEGPLKALKGA